MTTATVDQEIHNFRLTDLEVHGTHQDDDGNEFGRFTGWASVFGNVDATGEKIVQGAFAKTIRENAGTFPLLWSHNFFDMPLGLVDVEETKKGLRVKEGQINLSTEAGRSAYELLKQGAIRAMSIGFRTVKEDVIDNVRHLKEIRLFEVSLVNFPANRRALVTGVKHLTESLSTTVAQLADTELDEHSAMLVEDAIEALRELVEPAAGHSQSPQPPSDDESDLAGSLIATIDGLKTAIRKE